LIREGKVARAKISDVAKQAGLSVSTVNRVLNEPTKVREETFNAVLQAAEAVGFYGLGTIRSQINARRPKYRFGFLLLQPTRTYYKILGAAIETVTAKFEGSEIEAVIIYAEDLSPQHVAARLLELGNSCQAVAVVAAVHPLVLQAVDTLQGKGVPVFGLISQLSATGNVNYVGLDNWKVGRTAAWAIANVCKQPGKVGILVGNHRFRCQEMNETGFRSYFREFAPDFTLLEPLATFETSAVAEELTEKLVAEHSDLSGLFVAGGGISGVMAALRTCGKAGQVITVCHQLMDNTRLGLLDGTLSMVINSPTEMFVSETVSGMIRACQASDDQGRQTIVIPFEIFTRENI
jgi:LacI family transcriptional regulator